MIDLEALARETAASLAAECFCDDCLEKTAAPIVAALLRVRDETRERCAGKLRTASAAVSASPYWADDREPVVTLLNDLATAIRGDKP